MDEQTTRLREPALVRLSPFLWVLGGLYLVVTLTIALGHPGYDSRAYWLAWHRHAMYGIPPNHEDAFVYSPVFAQALWPLAQLPWPTFFAFWTVAGVALYAWLLRPLEPRWRVPLLCLCVPQAIIGNLWPLFAVVVVLGFRRPALWAVPLLTKGSSAMGFVWFAMRREWRPLARALLVSSVLVGVSVAVSPSLWNGWLHLLVHGGTTAARASGAPNIPLLPRLPFALGLAVYGARRDRPEFLVAAVAVGSPVFTVSWLLSNLFVASALPRLCMPLRPGATASPSPIVT